MPIHTVKESETVYQIARDYGVSPTKIIENNELHSPDRLSVGQELLILVPTRTYTVRGKDTLSEICQRFGISKETAIKNNPALRGGEKIYPEEILAIKYSPPPHAISLVNGYVYNGTDKERLAAFLPYLSYATFSTHRMKGKTLEKVFNPGELTAQAKSKGKRILMRIFSREEYDSNIYNADLADAMVKEANAGGFDGIMLSAASAARNGSFADFLFDLKRKAIEREKSLFIEADEKCAPINTDIADAVSLIYDKCSLENIPSFSEGEERIYKSYAENQDSSKTFMDFSPFAYKNGKPITKAEAERTAFNLHKKIEYDGERMLCKIKVNEFGGGEHTTRDIVYPSLKNIKAKLDLAGELGYLGISVDVMRCPIEHIMLIHSQFLCGKDYFDI